MLPCSGLKYQLRELMQSYLDNTSDVQTVCLALTMAKKYEPTMDTISDTDPTDFSNIVMENYLRYFGGFGAGETGPFSLPICLGVIGFALNDI